MSSKIIEVWKFCGQNLIYEFDIEKLRYHIGGENFETNKWLQSIDWIQIYENLQKLLEQCDVNHNTLNICKDFTILNFIEVFIKTAPLQDHYLKLFNLNKKNTINNLLQIQIKRIKLQPCDKVELYETQILVDETTASEYDPLEVGNINQNHTNNTPTYTPSKKRRMTINEGDSIEENDPYSPKPLCDPNKRVDNDKDSEERAPSVKPIKGKIDNTTSSISSRRSSLRGKPERVNTELKSLLCDKEKQLPSSSSKTIENKKSRKRHEASNSNSELFGSDDSDQRKCDKIEYNTRNKIFSKKHNPNKKETTNVKIEKKSGTKSVNEKILGKDLSGNKELRICLSPLPIAKNKKKLTSSSSGQKPPPLSSSSSSTSLSSMSPLIDKSLIKTDKSSTKDLSSEQEQTEEFKNFLIDQAVKQSKTPADFKFLTLHHLDSDSLLSTYKDFKETLKQIHKTNKFTNSWMPSHTDLTIYKLVKKSDHCELMTHLRNYYEKRNIFLSNAVIDSMLREWILRIFMKEYKFNDREEAIKLIIQQEKIESGKPENVRKLYDEMFADIEYYRKSKSLFENTY